jgi:hypothetical protein
MVSNWLSAPRLWLFAGLAIIGVATAAAWAISRDSAEATDLQALRDAVARLSQDDGTAAAVVNGTSIPVARIEAFAIARTAASVATNKEVAELSLPQYVRGLIDNELLFQEAERRGLSPTDDEVKNTAVQTKAGLLQVLEEDTEAGRIARSMFKELEGTPFHVSVYDTSPEILEMLRRSIAVSRLREEVFMVPESQRNDVKARENEVKELTAALRAQSDIEVSEAFR